MILGLPTISYGGRSGRADRQTVCAEAGRTRGFFYHHFDPSTDGSPPSRYGSRRRTADTARRPTSGCPVLALGKALGVSMRTTSVEGRPRNQSITQKKDKARRAGKTTGKKWGGR